MKNKRFEIIWMLLILNSGGFAAINPNNMSLSSWQAKFKGVWHATGQGTTDDGRPQKVNADQD